MRHQLSLSGPWQFQLDPDGSLTLATLAPDRTIAVPLPWQAAFPELQAYSGYAWYRRSFDLAAAWLDGELLLTLGAVDYWCQVFINGELAGEHEGGYTPITLAIGHLARAGLNEIAVRVYDSAQPQLPQQRWLGRGARPAGPPFDAADIPHGKQEWYLNVGGIWQDVTLTAVPAAYIAALRVTPNIHTGEARLEVALAGALAGLSGTLQLAVADGAGGAWTAETPLVAGQAHYAVAVTVSGVRLWSPEAPNLYTASAALPSGDSVSARFGFREIGYSDGRLLLNGAPLFLLSALDQDLYPETIYTVPSEAFLRDQFQKAKQLGLNNLRCHIKPPDPLYLDLADELGLLVWAEIPSWRTFYRKGTLTPEQRDLDATIRARVERTLEELIARDYNHASLVIWTIVNEDWGTSLALSASDRAWVAAMYARCKQLDPTRLCVDNSPCLNPWGPNIHVHSDIDDFHVYANIPDQAAAFTQAIEQFNLRPLWSYSSHGDATRNGREPLILSEFGNWGLPSLQALLGPDGEEPAWFGLGPWWSGWDGEPGWPAGVQERFARLGLDTIWPSYEAFATATQWHQFAALKFEIETMRRQPNLAGYVITELSDIYWESNGLLDFHRNPKVYHERFASINAPDVIVPQPERYVFWDDEPVRARLHLSRYGAASWEGAALSWRFDAAAGELAAPALARGEVAEIGAQRWPAPAGEGARTARVELVLRDADGAALAENQLELLILPAAERAARYRGLVAVVGGPGLATEPAELEASGPDGSTPESPPPDGLEPAGLEGALRRLGYSTTGRLGPAARVAVTTSPTAELLGWVRNGGDLLYLNQGVSPFFWTQGRGGAYSGGWMSNFSWLRPGVHRRLEVASPLGLPFAAIMPARTIVGVPVEDPAVHPDILAGLIGGWINHPAVHTLQLRYGRGRVLMTTFTLAEALPGDPAAVAMFHDLLEHLVSEACRPTLAANY